MSTASTFTRKLAIGDIPGPAMSAGAHLGAKLELFCTDERTLTDELCDMLCIWLALQSSSDMKPSTGPTFDLTISKTTTAQEVKIGSDLELIVQSPFGSKRCLMQAKVLDPKTDKLRCSTKQGWNKLRKQLIAARREVGDLAFLLIYIPMKHLDGMHYGYGTYEQGGPFPAHGKLPAAYGATLIPVNALIGISGRWRYRKDKVPRSGLGGFRNGIPFWRVLIELMLCRRGAWLQEHDEKVSIEGLPAFRTLGFTATKIERGTWSELQQVADRYLRDEPRPNA